MHFSACCHLSKSAKMTSPVSKPLSIFIYSVEGLGHLNACIGLAQELVTHVHRVTFLTSETSKGQFEKFGFAEIVLHSSVRAECQAKGPPPPTDEKPVNPMKIFAQILLQSGLLSSKSSLEKAQIVNMEVFDNMYHALIELNPQIEKLIEKEKPDAIIVDHFYIPPAIQQSTHAPWIMLWSGNPLALYGSSELPPFASGYATKGDRAEWREFDRVHRAHFINKIKQNQKRLNEAFNYEPIREYGEPYFNETSPYLNIYGYPQELDYQNEITIPERFVRVDAFCRDIPEPFQLPEGFADKHKLIYLSLGSMGGADVELMKRIISAIAKTPHKCIVSKGPLHDEYELPSNCWGEAFLPQTRILPILWTW